MKKSKKNLGFTMIEMLATILILLVIIIIATPSIRRMLNRTNELSKEYIENIVIDAAKEYTLVNNKATTDSLKSVDDTSVIGLEVLLNVGLIEQTDIDKLDEDARVLLTLKADNYIEYKIVYDSTLATSSASQLILLGENPTYVGKNSTYLEPGYIGLDNNGDIITNKVTVTGTVDTTKIGNYTLTYKLIDSLGNEETKTRTVIVYDSTYPKVTVATTISNNPYNNKLAKNGETITLNITFSKAVTTPKVTIGGRIATVTGSGTTRVATLTIPTDEATLINGGLSIKVSDYKDEYDNIGEEQTNVTSGGLVVFDNVKPVIRSTTIVSNNTNNKLAKNNETITMTTTFTEAVMNVSTRISGRNTTISGNGTSTITGSYLIPSNESTLTEGNIVGSIVTYMDSAGNIGEVNDIKLSGGTVLYDRTKPSCAVSGGSSTWTKGNRTITGTCSDTGSGCTGNISYTYSSDINTTTAGAGGNNIGGTVTDNAGNSTTCLANQTVKVDKTNPTYTSFATSTTANSGTLTITGGADSGSGISTYKYYLDGVLKGTTTSTSYTYTGLSSATNYTMSFEIVDNVGNIATSSKSVATSINIPTSLVATKGTTAQGRQITLNWNANGNTSNISYKVLGSTDNTTFTELGTVSGTSYTDGGIVLPNNNGGTTVTKYYKVQAVAPNGATSSETSSVSGNTLASPTVTASMDAPLNSGKNTINLSWNAVSGASGYKIAILDGQAYRHVDLGNVTSWNSDTAKIFPTTAQINAWDGTSNPFRLSGDGTTYPSDANVLYSKAERTTHHNHHYIVWIHVYSYDSASRASGGVQSGATNLSRTNPDRDAPSCAVSGGSSAWTKGNRTVTGTCNDGYGVGCTGNISYTYSNDINTTTAGAGGNNVGGTVTDNAGNSTTCLANQTVKVDKTAPTVTETYSGGMVFTDPNFSSGINGFTVYNNNKNGTVTQSREAVSNPWGSYVMRIVTNGSASPGLGGFAQRVTSRANATYIHIIRAKIPVGYTINYASNAVGDSPERYWLTPREGTGNWEEYSFVLKTSGTGTFSTFGHTYVSGPGTSVTWDVAYSTIIDTERKGISGNIVFRTTDVGSGYTHYGINQSSTTEPTYTSITNSSDLGVEKGGYTTNGTYYIWVKDAAGNVGKKSVSMTAVDTTPPTCVATKSNTGTTAGVTVTVTGTDYESGIVSGEVTDTGVKANKTYTVTNGVGLTGTCSVTVTSEIQYRSRTCTTHESCEDESCGCAEWGNHTVTKTYPSGSTGCTDSGSTTDQTYIRCFVNTYVCECSCPVTGANWKTTWYGGTPCNATRCWNNGGSSGECISPTHTYANPTYTVNQYEKQTWTSTTCVTYASCPNPSCTCSTWSGWSTWSTTTCEEQTNVRECANRTVYY